MTLPSLAQTPSHNIKLPSTGKTVTLRPYKVKEEKVLLMAAESKNSESIFNALVNVIQDCVVKPSDFQAINMTTFDLEYTFLTLRALSVGETAPLRMKCQDADCSGETEIVVNLQDIHMEGEEDIKQKAEISLTPKIRIEVGYPTVKHLASHPEFFAGGGETPAASYELLKSCIRKVLTASEVFVFEESTQEEQEAFIDEMTPQHTAAIGKYLETIPSVVVKTEFNCSVCGKKNELELRGLQDFFS